MRAGVLLVFILGLGCGCLAGEDGEEGSCSDYCAATYPEHTYPKPQDHCACARGCRIAIMDALISWPFSPERSFCLSACEEAYGSDGHLYACQTGCNVTTIDQKVPNRDRIYQTGTKDMGFVAELLEIVSGQLPPLDGGEVGQLTQHAESLYQLLPGGAKVSTIVIIEGNDESVEIHYEQSVVDGPSSSYERVESLPREEEEEEEEGGEVSSYRLSCPWKYTATGRLLSVVGVGLVVVAVVACCCSGFLSDEAEEEGTKRRELVVVQKKVLVSPQLKSFFPGFPQPLPYYCEKKSTQL